MVAIVVEDGTIVSGANSYISEAELATYATNRGITITGNKDELLIQAMDYIEGLRYIGFVVNNDQPLQWPRTDALRKDAYFDYYDIDEIPQKLKDGLAEAALAIDAGNSPLANIERKTRRKRVGELEVEYDNGSASQVIVQKINNKLRDLLRPGFGLGFTVTKA